MTKRLHKIKALGAGAADARILASNVLQLRVGAGLRQQQLSELAEISVRTLLRIESAQIVPDLNTVAALAKALKTTVPQLLMEN